MSRKSFTDGLESLFSSAREERALRRLSRPGRHPGPSGKEESTAVAEEEREVRTGRRGSHQKTFALDIEAFLEDVLQESIREELEKEASRPKKPDKELVQEPPTGVDALIRSTLESGEMEIQTGKTRRVTFFFDERKVERLKEIAKRENIYLREVISRIVAEYLSRMERGD
ncbi:MAG: hypothetical protein J5I41_11245 [Saprospiraceae bacterium]|nr:hypothetical protein [Saprospiraceae bacterium]